MSIPTITVASHAGYNLITPTNSAAGATNTLYRANATETDGAYIALTTTLGYNEPFADWNVASGAVYLYKVTENVSGTLQDSAAASSTITLTTPYIHAVSRTKRASNIQYRAIAIRDQSQHNEDSAFAVNERGFAGAVKTNLAIGGIELFQWSLTHIIPFASDSERQTFRSLWGLNVYYCLRDVLGNKVFVRMDGYKEEYDFGLARIPIAVTEITYSEDVTV